MPSCKEGIPCKISGLESAHTRSESDVLNSAGCVCTRIPPCRKIAERYHVDKELQQKLQRRFPVLYRDLGKPDTSMELGIACGNGWFDLLWRLPVYPN